MLSDYTYILTCCSFLSVSFFLNIFPSSVFYVLVEEVPQNISIRLLRHSVCLNLNCLSHNLQLLCLYGAKCLIYLCCRTIKGFFSKIIVSDILVAFESVYSRISYDYNHVITDHLFVVICWMWCECFSIKLYFDSPI